MIHQQVAPVFDRPRTPARRDAGFSDWAGSLDVLLVGNVLQPVDRLAVEPINPPADF